MGANNHEISWNWKRRFRWYRKMHGGYWTRSHKLGWQRLPDWSADIDLAYSKKRPDMYRNGRDVEDYRLAPQQPTDKEE